jgi:putative DNA primase/helicase
VENEDEDSDEELKEIPWEPTRSKVADLAEAIAAIVILPAERSQPCWLDDRETGAIVSLANGLLDLATRRLMPHTPKFFNQTAVPFDYEPNAPPPNCWLLFLNELWPSEAVVIALVSEWFGYVISGRLDLQKIFMMVGPTRGGKGVIARVLEALLGGPKNVAGPTLSSLGETFGLEPLIGKPLAVVADARFSTKNSETITERLLSISGQDTLTVHRKYKVAWTGQLPSRLHVLSNELPRLGDASTAIVGRILLVLTTRSWLGQEDHELEVKLRKELTGILNWSLDGLTRLTNNDGRFTRLPSAEEAITQMRDLASPVAAFVREQCRVDPEREIEAGALYKAYKSWAEDNGHPKPSKQNFGRDLRAAVPSIRVTRPKSEGGEKGDGLEKRPRFYSGITLADEAEPAKDAHACAHCGKTDGRAETCAFGYETLWLDPECQRAYAKAAKPNQAELWPKSGRVQEADAPPNTQPTPRPNRAAADGASAGAAPPSSYLVLGSAGGGSRCTICGGGAPRPLRIRRGGEINVWHQDCAERYLAALANQTQSDKSEGEPDGGI